MPAEVRSHAVRVLGVHAERLDEEPSRARRSSTLAAIAFHSSCQFMCRSARGRTRTCTGVSSHGCLRPMRLPISPPKPAGLPPQLLLHREDRLPEPVNVPGLVALQAPEERVRLPDVTELFWRAPSPTTPRMRGRVASIGPRASSPRARWSSSPPPFSVVIGCPERECNRDHTGSTACKPQSATSTPRMLSGRKPPPVAAIRCHQNTTASRAAGV